MSVIKSLIGLSAIALIAAGCSKQADDVAASNAPATAPVEANSDSGGMASMAGMASVPAMDGATAVMSFTKAPLMDPNTAEMMALASLPQLSEAEAQKLVDARPFETPSDMHAVLSDSKSEAELKALYSVLFVKVGLNSGADADYRLIPSTLSARKLAHEFEEYRPYSTMDDFKREMAKYVSAAEVEFLSRYVTLD